MSVFSRLWRRHRDDGFAVELGGQRFTQAQWEAAQTYKERPPCSCPDPEMAARSGHVAGCAGWTDLR